MKNAYDYLVDWCCNDSIKKYLVNAMYYNKKIDFIVNEILTIYKESLIVNLESRGTNDECEIKLCIHEIKNPTNIGALCDEAEFKLGKKLNIFYGENGSGKSTYVKIFRKMSKYYYTSTKDLSMKTNVYKEGKNNKQTVCVSYSDGNQTILDEVIDINSFHDKLSRINVFDSDSLQPLLNKDLSFSVLPNGLNDFITLTDLIIEVKRHIQIKIEELENKKSAVFQDSKYAIISDTISGITKEQKDEVEVFKYLDKTYGSKNDIKLKRDGLEKIIQQMKSSNQAELIQILKAQYNKLLEISDTIRSMENDFSVIRMQNVQKLQQQYNNLVDKEKDENKRLAKQLENVTINTEWDAMIHAAEKYFVSLSNTLPTVGSKCILCGNEMGQEQVEFINICFEHLKNSIAEQKNKIKEEINKQIPTDKCFNLPDSDKNLLDDKKILVEKIDTILKMINNNRIIFQKHVDENKNVPDTCKIDFTSILSEISTACDDISEKMRLLNQSNGEILENLNSKERELNEIRKICLLYESRDEFKQWYEYTSMINMCSEVQKKMNTKALTKKSEEAFSDLVGTNYLDLFNEFCYRLGAKNVSVKLTPRRGETKRSKYIVSEKNAITEIMSEGEQKAVALAEFATDIKIRENMSTILFDDPVTSFDYKRAEKIAEIIYELSQERQIIVFTHNIMFYYKLYSFLQKSKDKENMLFKVDEFDRDNKGIVSNSVSGRLENLKDIIKKIKDSSQTINSKKCVGDQLDRNLQIVYSDIRTWCELIIEEGFLCGIIRRYEPNIRFTAVTQIKDGFVNELPKVNAIFEKACRYMNGHSQPIETLNVKPTREEFMEDFTYIIELSDRFKST